MKRASRLQRVAHLSARLFAIATVGGGSACGSDDGVTAARDAGADVPIAIEAGAVDAAIEASDADASLADADPALSQLRAKDAFARVSILQGVTVALVDRGAAVTTLNAPIVAGRPALVRVAPSDAARARGVQKVTLTIVRPGRADLVLESAATPDAGTEEGDLGSTFNFDLAADVMTEDARFALAILPASGALPIARFPDDRGTDSLRAQLAAGVLRVRIVPIEYRADNSSRLPDTSPARLKAYRDVLFAAYPTDAVEITVRAPLAWDLAMHPDSSYDASKLLDRVIALRAADAPPDDVYYYALFVPSPSEEEYCNHGCILGVSQLAEDDGDPTHRASLGVGFPAREWTMAHEIGHAMGRKHSPCGAVADPDPDFPRTPAYAEGRLGVWGYDLNARALVSPDTGRDFMSYCKPPFVSDYTYRALFARIAKVNAAPRLLAPMVSQAPSRYRFVTVRADGTLAWGQSFTSRTAPRSRPTPMQYVDAHGEVIAHVTGFYYPYADAEGGHYVVPEGPANAGLRIAGARALLRAP
jgi:hypothetical protein